MAVFRAVENGAAMVRSTRWGHSAATDPYGRVLSFMDDFATRDGAMVAQVPVAAGVGTVYACFGDWLGWLCVAGLGFLVVLLGVR
jgi:apolipoprotein N-acyltransferase